MTHLQVLNAIIELSAPEGVIDLPQPKLLQACRCILLALQLFRSRAGIVTQSPSSPSFVRSGLQR